MIKELPIYISLIFVFTTVLTLFMFHRVVLNSASEQIRKNAPKITIGLSFWLLFQAFVSLQYFYSSVTNVLPPRIFLLGILPPFSTILVLFLSSKGRNFINSLSLKRLTLLNIVRIPVEFVLWWLSIYECVPELMTFEGRNFDIIAGITAPLIVYLGFSKKIISKRIILAWNILCLGLLINIVVNGFLSAPTPLQKFAFDQPNIALIYFPFSWLVSFIVPIVLFGHLISIKQLVNK